MTAGPPPTGGRGNGLAPQGSWVALGECDPRVADELLGDLALARIPAYALASPGSVGGYLELRLPVRPVDRLFVDGAQLSAARQLVSTRLAETGLDALAQPAPAPLEQDAAFAAIIADFQAPTEPGSWPASEDLGPAGNELDLPAGPASTRRAAGPVIRPATPPGLLDPGGLLYDSPLGDGGRLPGADPFAGDEHHYLPPAPPPVSPWHPVTRAGALAVLAGLLSFLLPPLGVFTDATVADALGATLIVAGTAALVSRLREDRPADGPDDGAVV